MDRMEIKLAEQLDMSAVPALKEELIGAANSANGLRIDASEVERVGTPAIQLLIAAAKAFAKEDREFVLDKPSQILIAALEDLGVGPDPSQWSTH